MDDRARYARNRVYVKELKELAPCMDCGVNYPYYVMDFDHVRGEKLHNISDLMGTTLTQLRAEIAKCDPVCSNCHRIRTHTRGY